jgi:hypothetical protein
MMIGLDSSNLSKLPEKSLQDENLKVDAFLGWELAQNRVLLYLMALNVGPDQRLKLAMQAYERAKTRAKTKYEAVPVAMISLRQILVEHNIVPDVNPDFSAQIWRNWAGRYAGYAPANTCLAKGVSVSALAMPPIHRQSMPPAMLQFTGRRRVRPR